jgi:hypothetical protein
MVLPQGFLTVPRAVRAVLPTFIIHTLWKHGCQRGEKTRHKEMVRRRPEDRLASVGCGVFFQMVLGEYLPNWEVIVCKRDLL